MISLARVFTAKTATRLPGNAPSMCKALTMTMKAPSLSSVAAKWQWREVAMTSKVVLLLPRQALVLWPQQVGLSRSGSRSNSSRQCGGATPWSCGSAADLHLSSFSKSDQQGCFSPVAQQQQGMVAPRLQTAKGREGPLIVAQARQQQTSNSGFNFVMVQRRGFKQGRLSSGSKAVVQQNSSSAPSRQQRGDLGSKMEGVCNSGNSTTKCGGGGRGQASRIGNEHSGLQQHHHI